MELLKEFTHKYFLSAAECNPEQEMTLPLLMNRIIDIATRHANSWGVGYERLIKENQGWVLSRVTFEMKRYPRANEHYTFTTWIEDYNRHFSQRNMEITDESGAVIGHVRTIWMVINFATRESVDISKFEYIRENVSGKKCPIEPQSRLRPINTGKSFDHVFKYADSDVNRHVNTTRYLELLMNHFPLEKYDSEMVSRVEIAFMKEILLGEKVTVNYDDSNVNDVKFSIDSTAGAHCRARFCFTPRE